jgi:putative ABC transport system substrate-binding protein
MRRRELIALVGGAAAAWPLSTRAQQTTRIWRVGYLSPVPESGFSARLFRAFVARMQELGYVEGRNLILDVRRADGDFSRLPDLAAELVSLNPDVIVGNTTPAIAAVQKATSSIPIVMTLVADPIGSGLIKSLAKPGGNITGVSAMLDDLTGKLLDLLLLVVPHAQRIAVLTMPDNPLHSLQTREIHSVAQERGWKVVPAAAIRDADFEQAFDKFGVEKCDCLFVLPDPRTTFYRRIIDFAAKARLPAIYQVSAFVPLGGLLSYSADFVDIFRRGAEYVDRILKGAAPAEMPVEQPTKFELHINLRTAKALGLTIPESILVRADEVIE